MQTRLLTLLLTLALLGPALAQNLVTPITNPKLTGTVDLSGASNKSTIRTDLGLALGTDVQAYNATLAALAGNTTGTLALGNVTLTLAGLSTTPLPAGNLTGSIVDARLSANVLLSTSSYANPAWVTSLGWSKLTGTPTTLSGYGITDAQTLDSDLTAIAALSTTTYGRALLTQADAATARGTLGLGSVDNTSDAAKNAATATLTNKTISGSANTLTNLPAVALTNPATGTTITLGNLTIGALAGMTLDKLTLTAAMAGSSPVLASREALGATGGAPGELVLKVNNATGNSIAYWNTNPNGFAAPTWWSSTGYEHAAMGIGGPNCNGGAWPAYANNFYIETTDANLEGWTPNFVISQHGTFGGTVTRNSYARLVISSATGELGIIPVGVHIGNAISDILAQGNFSFDGTLPVLTLGKSGGYGELRGADQNFAIVLRSYPLDSKNANAYYAYGDTLANGGAHRFFSGGLRGGQTLQVTIANDRTQVANVFNLKPRASAPSSPQEGDCYANGTDHHVYCYNGTTWVQLDN